MITITVVRHGQSVDNNGHMWAGWRDAALSNNGMKQAEAVGKVLSDIKFDAIFHSPLKRAHWTADQIYSFQAEPKPPMTADLLLREQNFGDGEGKSWAIGGGYEQNYDRKAKFKNGEDRDDVRVRAEKAIALCIEPLIKECEGKPASSKHIAVVAHGIFNAEFCGALLARLPKDRRTAYSFKGMQNTGYHRIVVGYANEASDTSPVIVETNPEEDPLDPAAGGKAPPIETSVDESLAKLNIRFLLTNETKHLDSLNLRDNNIGHAAFDPKQQDLRSFFGANTASKV